MCGRWGEPMLSHVVCEAWVGYLIHDQTWPVTEHSETNGCQKKKSLPISYIEERNTNTNMIGGLLDATVIRTNGRRELCLGPLSWPSTDARPCWRVYDVAFDGAGGAQGIGPVQRRGSVEKLSQGIPTKLNAAHSPRELFLGPPPRPATVVHTCWWICGPAFQGHAGLCITCLPVCV